MNILYVTKFIKGYPGGIETAMHYLGKYISQCNNITIIGSNICSKGEKISSEKVDIHCMASFGNICSVPITLGIFGFFLKNRAKFDIIQISLPNPLAVIAYMLTRPKGKLIIWYHSDIVKQKKMKFFYKPFLVAIMKLADKIVCSSANYLKSSDILPEFEEKCVTIPYGIDPGPFDSDEEKEKAGEIKNNMGEPIVLFVGRHVYYKGLSNLIEAIKNIDVKLLVIGEGPLKDYHIKLAGDLGVDQKIIFRKVPDTEPIARYIHASDILVLPSIHRSEAFGIVLLEAMACSKPVITTELGTGTTFVCIHNETGIIVPPSDTEALKKAILAILHDDELKKNMGIAGRSRLEEQFTHKKMGDAFLDLYKNMMGD